MELKERMDLVPAAMDNPFKKKLHVDVSFKNIKYEVSKRIWRQPFLEKREILHGVSGTFSAGQLTAIMGPSGAGKSTLLNILAGYTFSGMTGQVMVNGQERCHDDISTFKRVSSYIQQDDYLRDYLTVQETMVVAAELKLGRLATRKQKLEKIYETLELLSLTNCVDTMCARLSGGQRKRLSVAFELLTNPPVIFLDEPTTGLDSSSCSQCVSLLRMMAGQGRTVIATIHQPSALIFEKFDQLYALAEGHCIYSGPVQELVPYLSSTGFVCPTYHNPADFLLELASGEYGSIHNKLIFEDVKNKEKTEIKKPKRRSKFKLINFTIEDFKEGIKKHQKKSTHTNDTVTPEQLWPNSFFRQFYLIYTMNILILQKAYVSRLTTTFSHILLAALIGCLFYGTGNNAAMVRNNMCFVFGVLLFVVYTGKMAVALHIPKELPVLQVEHFNRWYPLVPYYLAFIAVEIPFQVFNCLIAYPILYFLSDQPTEVFRYTMLFIVLLAGSLTGQSLGFLLGAAVPVKIGVFLGPVGSCILSVFGFSIRYSDSPIFFKGVALLSYIRAAFSSGVAVLYDYNRENLHCPDDYCLFERPKYVLQELDMVNVNVSANIAFMVSVIVIAHLATFCCLYFKLNRR